MAEWTDIITSLQVKHAAVLDTRLADACSALHQGLAVFSMRLRLLPGDGGSSEGSVAMANALRAVAGLVEAGDVMPSEALLVETAGDAFDPFMSQAVLDAIAEDIAQHYTPPV